MSSTYGEDSPSEYDFSLEIAGQAPHYDPDRIMAEVIWPALNHLSRRDWQEEAFIGQDFLFPARGQVDDMVLDVSLHAYCFGIKREDLGCSQLGHNLAVEIEEMAPEHMSELILGHARVAEPDLMEALVDYEGLVLKKGVQYAFNTEEEAAINAFQTIEDEDGAVIWVSDRIDETIADEMAEDTEIDEVVFDTDKFYVHDLESIARGLSILGAPEQSIRALSIIKGQPIEVDDHE